MAEKVKVTGASQRCQSNANGEWCAWYECHKCSDEFAMSGEFCKNEAEAREKSNTALDKQLRRYCSRCGYKLTTNPPVPDDMYIAALNRKIDALRTKRRKNIEKIKTLMGVINGMTDAERIAVSKGWIKAVTCEKEEEVPHDV